MSDEDYDWFKDELIGEHSEMKERLAKFEWRPIETAPKDGASPILVAVRSPMGIYMAVAQYVHWENGGRVTRSQWCMKVERGFMGLEYPPTHWMPLPKPPADLLSVESSESQSLARE